MEYNSMYLVKFVEYNSRYLVKFMEGAANYQIQRRPSFLYSSILASLLINVKSFVMHWYISILSNGSLCIHGHLTLQTTQFFSCHFKIVPELYVRLSVQNTEVILFDQKKSNY